MIKLFDNFYQLLFIGSIVYIINILFSLYIKIYGRFKLNKETTFVLSSQEKLLLWISISIFFSYLF
jgi:hypothetical protein